MTPLRTLSATDLTNTTGGLSLRDFEGDYEANADDWEMADSYARRGGDEDEWEPPFGGPPPWEFRWTGPDGDFGDPMA